MKENVQSKYPNQNNVSSNEIKMISRRRIRFGNLEVRAVFNLMEMYNFGKISLKIRSGGLCFSMFWSAM